MTAPLAVYSAPGKALLAGGYLVLFPEYSALSVGLSSRMHAAAAPNPTNELVVLSPQFDSEWRFPTRTGTHRNPFLEACYDTVKEYVGHDIHGTITIYSDAGFHSQSEADKNHFDGSLSRFSYHGKPITEVPKTGLGSSAALVVAVVAAMARLARIEEPELTQSQVHNLAQIAHCVAQQKVGSGFDVATAVYGSILYSRFQPSMIPQQLRHEELLKSVDSKWDMTAQPVKLPADVVVLMGDVSQGSETPGMVKKVLQWKSENEEEAQNLFSQLNSANMSLAKALRSDQSDRAAITHAIKEVRRNLKHLTLSSKVPIEPEAQTRLLDRASEVNGVLGGVVPGAGGDDAVCVLADTSKSKLAEIIEQLEKIEGVSWMNLNMENSGLRSEDVQNYV